MTSANSRAHGFVWPKGLPPCAMCGRQANDPIHVTPAHHGLGPNAGNMQQQPFMGGQFAADTATPHMPAQAHGFMLSSPHLLNGILCQSCGQNLNNGIHARGLPSGMVPASSNSGLYGGGMVSTVSSEGEPSTGVSAHELSTQVAFVAEIGHRLIFAAPVTSSFDEKQLPREVAAQWQKARDDNPYYMWIAGRYVEADRPNRNSAYWSTADLELGQPTVAHGPINWLHEEKHIIGAIAGSQMVHVDKETAATGDVGNHIVMLGAIWSHIWPQEANVIQRASDNGKLWACVDDETELLTSSGWMKQDALEPGVPILTLNTQSGLSEWLPTEKVNRYEVDTELVSMEGQQHSSMTTPNHRWFVRNRKGAGRYEPEWRESQTLTNSTYIPRAVAHNHGGFQKYQDEFVELLAWFWTEGTVAKKGGAVTIYQSESANPAYVDRIHACLSKVFGAPGLARDGGSWYTSLDERVRTGGRPSGRMVSFHLTVEASRMLTEAAPARVVHPEVIAMMTQAQLKLFIDTSIDADGSRATADGQVCITQKDLAGLRSFEMACALAGIPTNTGPIQLHKTSWGDGSEGPGWRTCLVRRSTWIAPKRLAAMKNGFEVKRVPYQGTVWCPTTANGTFLARRRGTVYWTGNSMECVSQEVACLMCDKTLPYKEYMKQEARCDHMREGQPRRFVDPTFGGAGIIVPPVRPGWANADVRVVMPEAAKLAERQAASFGDMTTSEAEEVVAQIMASVAE